MENNPIGELMGITMEKLRDMIDVNTIVGTPITTPDGVTLVPVSRVSFGFGAGGAELPPKENGVKGLGGGNGAGISIVPVAFIVIKDGNARLMHIAPPTNTSVDRLIELAPDIIDKVDGIIDRFKKVEE